MDLAYAIREDVERALAEDVGAVDLSMRFVAA